MKKLSIILALLTFLGLTTQTYKVTTSEPNTGVMICSDFKGEIFPKS